MSFQSQLLQSTVKKCFCYRAQRCLPTRRWKARLRNYGLLLDDTQERLTNIRYADDLLLFARTFDEAVFIFEALSEELANAGLSINATKTKILTTDSAASNSDVPFLADAGGCMIEVLRCEATHEYLVRLFLAAYGDEAMQLEPSTSRR